MSLPASSPRSPEAALVALAEAVRVAVAEGQPCTLRIPLAAPPADLGLRVAGSVPMAWFTAAHDDGEQDVLAGWGAADIVAAPAPAPLATVEEAIEAARARLPQDAAGLIGGVRFAPDQAASEGWAPFGAAWFLLPLVFVERRAGVWSVGAHLTDCGLAQSDIHELIESLQRPAVDAAPTSYAPAAVDDAAARYQAAVEAGLAHIASDEVQKVVLARAPSLGALSAPRAAGAVAGLATQERRGFGFWLQPGLDDAFFGFTPECLYRRRGTDVVVDALAGTTRRGVTDDDDRRFGAALLASDKDRREHAFVTHDVAERLAAVSDVVSVEDEGTPRLLRQSAVQHLYTSVRATLRTPAPLLSTLHPTPAVCGTPREPAAQAVRAIEGMDRGLYAGACGRVTAEGETFCVALRCARLHRGEATAYVGAGIVAGSDPATEWEETERKLAALRAALVGDQRSSPTTTRPLEANA